MICKFEKCCQFNDYALQIQLTLPKSNPLGLKKSLRRRENLTYVG